MTGRAACRRSVLLAMLGIAALASGQSEVDTSDMPAIDALIARVLAIDRRAADRRAPLFADDRVACEHFRAADRSCSAIVRTTPLDGSRRRFARRGLSILTTVHGQTINLLGDWVEIERDGFYCLAGRAEFRLRADGKRLRGSGVPSAYREALTLATIGMKLPLCSFWTGEGADMVETIYDGTGQNVGSVEQDGSVTRFVRAIDRATLRLRI